MWHGYEVVDRGSVGGLAGGGGGGGVRQRTDWLTRAWPSSFRKLLGQVQGVGFFFLLQAIQPPWVWGETMRIHTTRIGIAADPLLFSEHRKAELPFIVFLRPRGSFTYYIGASVTRCPCGGSMGAAWRGVAWRGVVILPC